MTSRTHTHKGHCQLCDRLQAVNNKTGLLAKHGYTKRWHFFSGTCHGSDHLPYEKSDQAIPPVIDSVGETIKRLTAQINSVKLLEATRPFHARLTIRRALPKEQRRWGGDNAERIEVAGEFGVQAREIEGEYTYIRTNFTPDSPVTFQNGDIVSIVDAIELYQHGGFYGCHGPAEHAAKWRNGEIKSLEQSRTRHAEYRTWLRDRVVNWKLAELVKAS